MAFLDELKDEIMTWIDDNQDPDCIREDIIRTVEEAIAQAPKRKARYAIEIRRRRGPPNGRYVFKHNGCCF